MKKRRHIRYIEDNASMGGTGSYFVYISTILLLACGLAGIAFLSIR